MYLSVTNRKHFRIGHIAFGSAACLALGLALPAEAADYTWLGGTGAWNSANWSIPGFPTISPPSNVFIDGGNPVNSTVSLFGPVQVINLSIGSGDTLNVGNNSVVIGVGGTITNNGTLNVNPGPNASGIAVTGNVQLQGSGQTLLNGPLAYIDSQNSGTLTIGADHTVSGTGNIGGYLEDYNINVTNDGTLQADNGILKLNATINSTGVLSATSDGAFQQTGGTVTAATINVASGGGYELLAGALEASAIDGNLTQTGGLFATGVATSASVITGNYDQINGFLGFGLDGTNTGQFDGLSIAGNVTLGGWLVLSSSGLGTVAAGSVFDLLQIGGTRSGTFYGLTEGSAVSVGGNTMYLTYAAGDGNDISLVSLLTAGSVNWLNAGASDATYVAGDYTGSPSSTTTFTYDSMDILSGSSFELGSNQTLDLQGGLLTIREGAVFTGNGIINGSVLNSGLVRIPITRLSQVTGGAIQVAAQPVITPTEPVVINEDTLVSIGNFTESNAPGSGFGGWAGGECTGCGGGGAAGGGGGGTLSQIITFAGDVAEQKGTFRVDSSLEVTGSYTQTPTGMLRLFVGGDDPADLGPSMTGGSYSQLFVGEEVALDGALQIVLQPELFDEFSYTPTVGDTFDFVVADGGITLSSTLEYIVFVTAAGANLLSGLTLSAYDSGIAADPDNLLRISEQLFSFALVENGTVLRGTLIAPLEVIIPPVPLPAAVWMFGGGLVTLLGLRRKRLS